jgi:hypothetical protein
MTEADRSRRSLSVGASAVGHCAHVAALIWANSGMAPAHMLANDGGYGPSSGRSLPVAPLCCAAGHHGFACKLAVP